jgi:hypothetical protein
LDSERRALMAGFSEIDPFLWAHKKFPLELLFVVYLFGS